MHQFDVLKLKVGFGMKSSLTSFIMCLSLVFIGFIASDFSRAEDAGAPIATKKKKSTDVSFDDVLVQGKYHFSDEAVTTVEDDKILDALLGVRKDFKDRIKKSTARH